jgi:hypothetical protein
MVSKEASSVWLPRAMMLYSGINKSKMNTTLIAEAVYCYQMSDHKDVHTAYRYECSLYELIREMTEEELAEYKWRIKHS